MANQSRFLLDVPLVSPGEYVLNPQESHHAVNVLRLREGDAVVVFDGQGRHAVAEVVKADRDGVGVAVAAVETDAHLPLALTLATAIPKGKRWQALVEKCTELGVDCIIPLLAERSVGRGEGDAERWRRWSVEAAKQCRRSLLPEITEPLGFEEVLVLAKSDKAVLVYADPGGEGPLAFQESLREAKRAVVMIGPEGGFSDGELALLRREGARALRLSPFILRIETAAAVVCALFREVL